MKEDRYYAAPDAVASDDELLDLWKIASAANDGDRHWTWEGGYPQTVLRMGDVALVANTYESPDSPARFAEFVAAFDPPTVLSLIRRAASSGSGGETRG